MSRRMLRPRKIYGPGNPIPVSRSSFYQNYVFQPGRSEFIPGTNVKRLRLAKISERAVAAFEDEIELLVEALRAERDARPNASR
jgi:hypothetical protein